MSSIPTKILYNSGFTTVYLKKSVEDDLSSQYIIKTVGGDIDNFEENKLRFQNELEISNQLNIPGVRRAIKVDEYNNSPAIWLEYLEATTIKDFFETNNPGIKVFLEIAIAVAETLAKIHQKGIIHKDINVNNILIHKDTRRPYIIDFDLATQVDHKVPELINLDNMESTLSYIAPEQTGRINRNIDQRSDLYSLGITFYQILTGQLPFDYEDPIQIIHAHLAKLPPLPHKLNDKIPLIVSEIIRKLIEKTPEDRYQSAHGLKFDLQKALECLEGDKRNKLFLLGRKDFSGKFSVSEKLYGVEGQLKNLFQTFTDAVEKDTTKLIVVSGDVGVGKTSFIKQLYKPAAERNARLVTGKFDQFQKGKPYTGIVQAIQEWVELTLEEQKDVVDTWGKNIQESVGKLGKVLTDFIPSLQLIIGEQAEAGMLDTESLSSRNRFKYLLSKLIKSIATEENPLVLFLDDLQWADEASLSLVEYLLQENNIKNLLIVGAYRNKEVNINHPLLTILNKLKDEESVTQIHLNRLSLDALGNLLKDTFNTSIKKTHELALALSKKTYGNPLFVKQLLQFLYEKGTIFFSFSQQKWQWDVEAIHMMQITEDINDLITEKIRKLYLSTQEVLKIAACLGHQFEVKSLQTITKRKLTSDIMQGLFEATQAGLITPLKSTIKYSHFKTLEHQLIVKANLQYAFTHDVIQEAFYQLFSEQDKKRTHLRVGRVFAKNEKEQIQSDELFSITNHFNIGKQFISKYDEKIFLVKLNLDAAIYSKNTTSYSSAINYLRNTKSLLPNNPWEKEYQFALDLFCEEAEVLSLLGQYNESERLIVEILKHTNNYKDRSRAYTIKINSLFQQDKFETSNKVALKALKELGVNINEKPSILNRLIQRFKIKQSTQRKNDKLCEDEKQLVILSILYKLTINSYQNNFELFLFYGFKLYQLSVKYGKSIYSPLALTCFAVICAINKNYKRAILYAKEAQKEADKTPFQGIIDYWCTHHIHYFNLPFRIANQGYFKAYHKTLENGQLVFTRLAIDNFFDIKYIIGDNLISLDKRIQNKKDTYFITKQKSKLSKVDTLLTHMKLLLDNSYFEREYDELNVSKDIEKEGISAITTFATTAFYLNKHDKVLSLQKALSKHDKKNIFYHTFLDFYTAIILINKNQNLNKANKTIAHFKKLAKLSPANYANKYYLLKAEYARIKKDYQNARTYYDLAIDLAQKFEIINEEALANELAIKFYLENKQIRIGKNHLHAALTTYQKWGAETKVNILKKKYQQELDIDNIYEYDIKLKKESLKVSNEQQSNVKKLLNISQELSKEISYFKLIQEIMLVAQQCPCFETGLLLLQDENNWQVVAETNTETKETKILSNKLLGKYKKLPKLVINYVIRSQKELVIGDCQSKGAFITDKYIIQEGVRSIFCAPILYQEKLISIIYLENKTKVNAFSPQMLTPLRLLLPQIAISLRNAITFQDIETKLQERTHELTSQNKKIKDSIQYAQNIQQAILPLHEYFDKLFQEHFVIYKPKDIVSGDFYWTTFIHKKDIFQASKADFDKTFIAVVDCTGHGVAGAFMAMIGYSLLNEIIIQNQVLEPERILLELDKKLKIALRKHENTDKASDNSMDVSLLRIEKTDPNMCQVVFAGARNNLYYATPDGTLNTIKGSRRSIGKIYKNRIDFDEKTISLPINTTLYLTTDGFSDQNNPERKKFGNQKLTMLLSEISSLPLPEQREQLLNALKNFQKNTEQRDDITLLGIKI